MRYLIPILIILSSCSGEYHLRKAYKKGALNDSTYTEVVYDTVTVKLDTIIPIFYDSTVLNITDTVICVDGNPVLISKGKSDSERARINTTLEGGILTTSITCKAIEDSLRVSLKKNVAFETAITHARQVNSKLVGELEESNRIKGRYAIAAILIGIAFVLFTLTALMKRLL